MNSHRLILLDPGLTRADGHHLQMTLLIARACGSAGLPIRILANLALPEEVGPQEFERILRAGPYHLLVDDAASRSLLSFTNRCTCEDLRAHLSPTLRNGDVVAAHTLSAANLLGVATWWEEARSPTIRIAVWLILPADNDTRTGGRDAATEFYRRAFETFRRAGGNVRFFAETETLATHFRSLGAPEITVQPLPYATAIPTEPPASAGDGPPGDTRFVFLGEPREEKGFELVLEAIPDILYRLPGVSLLLPSSRRLSLRYSIRPIKEEIRPWLRQGFEAGIIRFTAGGYQSPDHYVHSILAADFVLLPYEPTAYALRSSSVLFEALAAGRPLVLTRQARGLAAVLDGLVPAPVAWMDSWTRAGFMGALAEARRNRAALAGNALHHAKRFRAAVSTTAFLRAVFG